MDTIFLLQDDETLRPLPEKEYVAEDQLQRVLARCPELLAGGQIDERDPRRWLLVDCEQGIPDTEDGGGRWAIDPDQFWQKVGDNLSAGRLRLLFVADSCCGRRVRT